MALGVHSVCPTSCWPSFFLSVCVFLSLRTVRPSHLSWLRPLQMHKLLDSCRNWAEVFTFPKRLFFPSYCQLLRVWGNCTCCWEADLFHNTVIEPHRFLLSRTCITNCREASRFHQAYEVIFILSSSFIASRELHAKKMEFGKNGVFAQLVVMFQQGPKLNVFCIKLLLFCSSLSLLQFLNVFAVLLCCWKHYYIRERFILGPFFFLFAFSPINPSWQRIPTRSARF